MFRYCLSRFLHFVEEQKCHELPLSLKWAVVQHPLRKTVDSSLHVSYISNSPSHSRSYGSDSVSSSCDSEGDHPQIDTHGWRDNIGGLVSRLQQNPALCRKCVGMHVACSPLCIPKSLAYLHVVSLYSSWSLAYLHP